MTGVQQSVDHLSPKEFETLVSRVKRCCPYALVAGGDGRKSVDLYLGMVTPEESVLVRFDKGEAVLAALCSAHVHVSYSQSRLARSLIAQQRGYAVASYSTEIAEAVVNSQAFETQAEFEQLYRRLMNVAHSKQVPDSVIASLPMSLVEPFTEIWDRYADTSNAAANDAKVLAARLRQGSMHG